VPPRVEYSLTVKGLALVPLIEDMRRYGREWLGVDDCAVTPASARQSVAA
jgi:DNA-binding HxlR family transcriptional regulator